MKKISTVFLCIFLALSLDAQTLETIDTTSQIFYYDYSYIGNEANKETRDFHTMVLEIGKKCSKFYSLNLAIRDSILATQPVEYLLKNISSIGKEYPVPVICNYYIFKEIANKDKITYLTSDRNATRYLIEEEKAMEWQICNDDSTILGLFNCRKATATYEGRSYTAWFTLDIPINDGPFKFHGLPGLILCIYDSQREHIFTLNGLNNTSYPIYKPKRKYVKTTTQAFQKGFYAGNEEVIKTVQTINDEEYKARKTAHLRSERVNFVEKY